MNRKKRIGDEENKSADTLLVLIELNSEFVCLCGKERVEYNDPYAAQIHRYMSEILSVNLVEADDGDRKSHSFPNIFNGLNFAIEK